MAITAATQLSDFSGFINRRLAEPYFEAIRRNSVVQQLARRVPLGPNGEAIPVTTSKPVAGWVSEGGQKPASEGGRTLATMDPKKLAVITVQSEEVVRANPGGFMQSIRDDIAEAFAVAFDAAVLHGTSSPFADDVSDTTKSVEIGTTAQASGGVYGDLVAGLDALVSDGKRLTGFAFGDIAEPLFLAATDTSGRPLFIESEVPQADIRGGRILGRPSFMGEGVDSGTTVGFGGDWSKIVWGEVGGIEYSVSTEATVTINGSLVSLFEHNLVAVRAETEYGMVMADPEHFVKYVDAV